MLTAAYVLIALVIAIVAWDFVPHAYRSVRKRVKREVVLWKHERRK